MTPFHGRGRCQDIACWHTCVSNSHLCIYGKTPQKPPRIQRCAQTILSTTCVSNPTTRLVNVIRQHVKSRDGKEWRARRWGKKEQMRKQNRRKLQTFQKILHLVQFACAFFLFSLSHQDGRKGREEGTKMLIKMRDCNNSPTTPIVITSIPLLSVFLDVLTRRNGVMHRTVWLIRMNWSI